MEDFRKFIRGPVGVGLLAVVAIFFVASGFSGYFQPDAAAANRAATVNDATISTQYLNNVVRGQREQMSRNSPGIDPSLLEAFVNPAMVLQGLINNELALQAAADSDMAFSRRQAGNMIKDIPAFQEDGKFSKDQMERVLRNVGRTSNDFIGDVQNEALLAQFKSAFAITNFSLPSELSEQRRLAEQQRDIRFAIKSLTAAAEQQSVSQEELEATYEANQDNYMKPERLKLEYVLLNTADYSAEIQITDAQVEQEYQTRKQALQAVAAQSERRRAAHIMISTDDRSEQDMDQRVADIKARLDAGEAFADVAKEMSDDLATANQGGSLGLLAQGDLPEELDLALFTLNEGDVSGPVKSDSGTHLLFLEGIEKREMPSFEEMAAGIRVDLEQGEALALINEAALELETLLFEHSSLEQPAQNMGLEVQTTEWFIRGESTGFASLPEVLEALNSEAVKNGENSDLLELADGRFAAVRIADRQPPALKPLEDVADEVRLLVKRDKAMAELDGLAQQAEQALADGTDVESVIAEWNVELTAMDKIGRRESAVSNELVREAFSVPRATVQAGASQLVRMANGDLAVLEVLAIHDGNVAELTEADKQLAMAELAASEGERNFRQVITSLRADADVQINESALSAN